MKIKHTKASRDSNGNPRYVVHFCAIHSDYTTAVSIVKKAVGTARKHNTKAYGGGIVFSSYDIDASIAKIMSVMEGA